MISPPLSPITLCVLVAAVVMGFTGTSCWDGVAAAAGGGVFELWLSQAGNDGTGP